MTDDLTPAERIADNIINGNISDAKRALRACSKRRAFEVVYAYAYRADVSTVASLITIDNLLP